jgi:hypothetical protein
MLFLHKAPATGFVQLLVGMLHIRFLFYTIGSFIMEKPQNEAMKRENLFLKAFKPTKTHFAVWGFLFLLSFFIEFASLETRVWPPRSVVLPFLVPLMYLWTQHPLVIDWWGKYLLLVLISSMVYWYLLSCVLIDSYARIYRRFPKQTAKVIDAVRLIAIVFVVCLAALWLFLAFKSALF